MDIKARKERLVSTTKPLRVDMGDGDFCQITYRRIEVTTKDISAFKGLIQEAKDAEENGEDLRSAELTVETQERSKERFLAAVATWDATSDGEPIPLTMEGLEEYEVPMDIINKIMAAIQKDQSPNPQTGRKSSNRS